MAANTRIRWGVGGAGGSNNGLDVANGYVGFTDFDNTEGASPALGDIVASDEDVVLNVVGSTPMAGGVIDSGNWNTGPNNRIFIIGEFTGVVWDPTKVGVALSSASGAVLEINVPYVEVLNLLVENTHPTPGGTSSAIYTRNQPGIVIANSITKGGRQSLHVAGPLTAYNTAAVSEIGRDGAGIFVNTSALVTLSHVIALGDRGLRTFTTQNGTIEVDNSWFKSIINETSATIDLTGKAVATENADGSPGLINLLPGNQFESVAFGALDFNLKDGNVLGGVGVLQSAKTPPLNVPTDQAGNAYANPPSIGVAAAPVVVADVTISSINGDAPFARNVASFPIVLGVDDPEGWTAANASVVLSSPDTGRSLVLPLTNVVDSVENVTAGSATVGWASNAAAIRAIMAVGIPSHHAFEITATNGTVSSAEEDVTALIQLLVADQSPQGMPGVVVSAAGALSGLFADIGAAAGEKALVNKVSGGDYSPGQTFPNNGTLFYSNPATDLPVQFDIWRVDAADAFIDGGNADGSLTRWVYDSANGDLTPSAPAITYNAGLLGAQANFQVPLGQFNLVLTDSATKPTRAQVVAGEDHNGDAALDAWAFAPITVGANAVLTNEDISALPDDTYYLHGVQDDGGNLGDVVTLGNLTQIAPAPPVVSQISVDNNRAGVGVRVNYTTNRNAGTAFVLRSSNATETASTVEASAQSQVVTQSGANEFALVAAAGVQGQYVHVVHVDVEGSSNVATAGPFAVAAAVAASGGDVDGGSVAVGDALAVIAMLAAFTPTTDIVGFSLVGGSLPEGVSLNGVTGEVSSANVTGVEDITYTAQIEATDTGGNTATQNLVIAVVAQVLVAPAIVSGPVVSLTATTATMGFEVESVTGLWSAYAVALTPFSEPEPSNAQLIAQTGADDLPRPAGLDVDSLNGPGGMYIAGLSPETPYRVHYLVINSTGAWVRDFVDFTTPALAVSGGSSGATKRRRGKSSRT